MAGKQAIVIGIDKYRHAPTLAGCERDADRIQKLFAQHEDGTSNMDVLPFTSAIPKEVSTRHLLLETRKMFQNNLELAVLYFAGHGVIDPVTGEGYLVTEDGGADGINWGIPVSTLLKFANESKADSKLIILDCCHSGSMGQISSHESMSELAMLGPGVTIMTASKENEVAMEYGAHGLFTSLLIDSLEGAAADISGRITPSALYAHIDKALATFEQRPLFKANLQSLVELRRVKEKIEVSILRKLSECYFKDDIKGIYPLGPEHEPDRGEHSEKYKDIKVDPKKEAAYRYLQACSRHGLVVPHEQPHMWHAAVHKTGCKLTALGRYYWKLGKNGRL